MVMIVHRDEDGSVRSTPSGAFPASVIWIDLLEPTAEERSFVERRTGLAVPMGDALNRISSFSRLGDDDGFVCLNTPVVARGDPCDLRSSPAGFMLSAGLLVTVRHASLPCFDVVGDQIRRTGELNTAADVFAALLEEIVDLGAEVLEDVGARIDAMSRSVFRGDMSSPDHLVRSNASLHCALSDVGVLAEEVSQVRDVLLGVGRIGHFAREAGHRWIAPETRDRLGAIAKDVAALNDYAAHLTDKDQFLLDAVLGYITVEQNELFRVLTIAAVVGIPPTLLAAVWGMNFATMPELGWHWGYPAALGAIAASAAVPLIWFKRRGWLR